MPLTLAEANKIVEVAVAKAKELKLPMAVAVCDAEGRLMAFNRIEGTFWITAFAAQGKAAAATACAAPLQRRPAGHRLIGGLPGPVGAGREPHGAGARGAPDIQRRANPRSCRRRAEVRLRRTRTACGRASRPSACSFLL